MAMEFKITQLRHFVWVAELKGFHAAAEKACRSQPAISLSIRDLETKLGAPLFEKRNAKTAKTELTPFGHHFLPKAKSLIQHHDRISEDMTLLSEHKSGHLRVASVPSIAGRVLPPLIKEFVVNAPDLHVSVFDDNTDAVLRMVESQQVDFGLCQIFDEQLHSDKLFTPLWQDQIGVVCPSDHPLADFDTLDWSALENQEIITNGTSRLLDAPELQELISPSRFYVSNMISIIAMLEAGFGVTTLPQFAFPPENTQLRFIPLTNPTVIRHTGIVQLKQHSLPLPAQAFIEFLGDNH